MKAMMFLYHEFCDECLMTIFLGSITPPRAGCVLVRVSGSLEQLNKADAFTICAHWTICSAIN